MEQRFRQGEICSTPCRHRTPNLGTSKCMKSHEILRVEIYKIPTRNGIMQPSSLRGSAAEAAICKPETGSMKRGRTKKRSGGGQIKKRKKWRDYFNSHISMNVIVIVPSILELKVHFGSHCLCFGRSLGQSIPSSQSFLE